MSKYLDSYRSLLSAAQQQKLAELLNVDSDSSASAQDLEARMAGLVRQLGEPLSPTMELRTFGDKTDSRAFNQTLREIAADLAGVFKEADLIDHLITNHHYLNLSVLESIRAEVTQLNRKIDALNLIADNCISYASATMDTFANNSMMEPYSGNELLYTERSGLPISRGLVARIESQEGVITLPVLSRENKIQAGGAKFAEIAIMGMTGEGNRAVNASYGTEKAIDSSDQSFWGELILADEPMDVDFEGIQGGAICKVKLTFSSPTTLNELVIRPYCEYPLEVVRIYYTDKEDGSSPIGYLVKEDHANLEQRSREIDAQANFRFPAITTRTLVFYLRQEHYHKNTYMVSKENKTSNDFWRMVTDAEAETTATGLALDESTRAIVNPQVDEAFLVAKDKGWGTYLEAAQKYAKTLKDSSYQDVARAAAEVLNASDAGLRQSIDKLLDALKTNSGAAGKLGLPAKPDLVQVDKYEYLYGMYDLAAYGSTYSPAGMYVSIPHKLTGNIVQVALEVDEEHPVFFDTSGGTPAIQKKQCWQSVNGVPTLTTRGDEDAVLRKTSVEYYISPSEHPGLSDWYPILPLGQSSVNGEMLFFEEANNSRARLRFQADSTQGVYLYRNEQPLVQGDQWDFAKDDTGARDYRYVSVNPGLIRSGDVFTIDYIPQVGDSLDPHIVNLDVKPISDIVTFAGTDSNFHLTLPHYPYVDLSQVSSLDYNPVRVTLVDGEVYVGGQTVAETITSTRNPDLASWRKTYTDASTTVPAARFVNLTDYDLRVVPELAPFDPAANTPEFQYCVDGNKVIFSEPFNVNDPALYEHFHATGKLRVEYQYLSSGLRVKIVLRQTNANSGTGLGVTPKVSSYILRGRSMQ